MEEMYDDRHESMGEPTPVGDMSEFELLERLFEVTCPSCDQAAIRQAAEDMVELLG